MSPQDQVTEQGASDRSSGRGATALALALAGLPLFYVLSPIFVAVLFRCGLRPPEPVMNAFRQTWFLLRWYTDSGLPGGTEYVQLIEWIAGT